MQGPQKTAEEKWAARKAAEKREPWKYFDVFTGARLAYPKDEAAEAAEKAAEREAAAEKAAEIKAAAEKAAAEKFAKTHPTGKMRKQYRRTNWEGEERDKWDDLQKVLASAAGKEEKKEAAAEIERMKESFDAKKKAELLARLERGALQRMERQEHKEAEKEKKEEREQHAQERKQWKAHAAKRKWTRACDAVAKRQDEHQDKVQRALEREAAQEERDKELMKLGRLVYLPNGKRYRTDKWIDEHYDMLRARRRRHDVDSVAARFVCVCVSSYSLFEPK